MSSEKKEEEQQAPPPSPEDVEAEIKNRQDMVIKANEAAERLEKANEQMLASLERQEKIIVENKLGGKADAGQPPVKEKSADDLQVEKIMKESGLDGEF